MRDFSTFDLFIFESVLVFFFCCDLVIRWSFYLKRGT